MKIIYLSTIFIHILFTIRILYMPTPNIVKLAGDRKAGYNKLIVNNFSTNYRPYHHQNCEYYVRMRVRDTRELFFISPTALTRYAPKMYECPFGNIYFNPALFHTARKPQFITYLHYCTCSTLISTISFTKQT